MYSDKDVHHYLGQRFDFSQKDEYKTSMMDYVCDASSKVSGYRATPAADGLFTVELAAQFHSRVAKLLYVALRCRPDIFLTESFLTSIVSSPTEEDWSKLEKLMRIRDNSAGLRWVTIVCACGRELRMS
jgi:hypothetical protein